MEPFFFAFLAAIGSALFALAQKEAQAINPFTFVAFSAGVAMILATAASPLFGASYYRQAFFCHWRQVIFSGIGSILVYVGFNLLFSLYGTTYYIIYAVLSIITTTFFVGHIYFKETFNRYHWIALASSMITVIFYSIGQMNS